MVALLLYLSVLLPSDGQGCISLFCKENESDLDFCVLVSIVENVLPQSCVHSGREREVASKLPRIIVLLLDEVF